MDVENRRRISKPVGVYVLTILILLGLGFFQVIRYWVDIRAANGDVPFPMVFTSFFVCIFSAGSAIWAFYGDNLGRVAVLSFVSLNALWLVFLTLTAVSYRQEGDLSSLSLIPELFRPLFWSGLTWWYFTRQHVIAYYKQESERISK